MFEYHVNDAPLIQNSANAETHTVINGKTERMLLPGYYIVDRRRDDDLVYTM